MSITDRPPSIHDANAPSFRVLSDAQPQRIHDAAVGLLADPGIRVTTSDARTLLLDAGASLSGADVVHVPTALVADALAAAPRTFTLHDRDGEPRAFLGEGRA